MWGKTSCITWFGEYGLVIQDTRAVRNTLPSHHPRLYEPTTTLNIMSPWESDQDQGQSFQSGLIRIIKYQPLSCREATWPLASQVVWGVSLHVCRDSKLFTSLLVPGNHRPWSWWILEHWKWVPSSTFLIITNIKICPQDAGLSFECLWVSNARHHNFGIFVTRICYLKSAWPWGDVYTIHIGCVVRCGERIHNCVILGGVYQHLVSSPNEFLWCCKFVDGVLMVTDLQCDLCKKFNEVDAVGPSSNIWHKVWHSISNIAVTHENKIPRKFIRGACQV